MMIRSAVALFLVAALAGCAVAQDDIPSAAHLVVHKVCARARPVTCRIINTPPYSNRHTRRGFVRPTFVRHGL